MNENPESRSKKFGCITTQLMEGKGFRILKMRENLQRKNKTSMVQLFMEIMNVVKLGMDDVLPVY